MRHSSLYDVTFCLVIWSHVPSGELLVASHFWGVSVRRILCQGHPPPRQRPRNSEERAACILLECFLVLCSRHMYRFSTLKTFRRDALPCGQCTLAHFLFTVRKRWCLSVRGGGSCVAKAGGHVWQGACVARGQGVHGRRDGHCSWRYASDLNAFLLNFNFRHSLSP